MLYNKFLWKLSNFNIKWKFLETNLLPSDVGSNSYFYHNSMSLLINSIKVYSSFTYDINIIYICPSNLLQWSILVQIVTKCCEEENNIISSMCISFLKNANRRDQHQLHQQQSMSNFHPIIYNSYHWDAMLLTIKRNWMQFHFQLFTWFCSDLMQFAMV